MAKTFTIRPAQNTPDDLHVILHFIKHLAVYEKMEDQVVADEATLQSWLFQKEIASVLLAEETDSATNEVTPAGFALYFHNFSTFLGRGGIYLEDLFVDPAHRGKGYGKALLRLLAAIAVKEGCGRLEWSCLDWNKPSIDFYLSLGAQPMDGWTTYRLTGETLTALAK